MDHFTVNNLKKIKNEVFSINKDCKIIAVSKTFNNEQIRPLIEYGHINFGENKVQEAFEKWSNIKNEFSNIQLHMIGRLQTNKVKQAVKVFDYIHSVDSIKLAKKISEEQKKISKNIKIFIQININNESQKGGVLINELSDFYNHLVKDLELNVIGLMCIPAINEKSKQAFEAMKNLNNTIGTKELSMGMSEDYLEALNCGSSYVRIGSKIFGKRY